MSWSLEKEKVITCDFMCTCNKYKKVKYVHTHKCYTLQIGRKHLILTSNYTNKAMC